MKKTTYKLLSKYIPSIVGLIASLLLLGMVTKTYTWIKTYGDFATKSFVLEAQAECNEKAENDLHRHENWESEQLKSLNEKIDRLTYIILQERK